MHQVDMNIVACVRAALTGEETDFDITKCFSSAYRHGVLNLLYYGFLRSKSKDQLDDQLIKKLKQASVSGILREIAQTKIVDELMRRFEASKIRCVTLKGAAIKNLYPKPELRGMSDIDILIDASMAPVVRNHLQELGCEVLNFDQGTTDLYCTKEGIVLEIKRTLTDEAINENARRFLEELIYRAEPIEDHQYVCRLPNEDHYAYILHHIVKHFINGGVGIRPIMDVWICRNKMQLDETRLAVLLEELELTKFAETVEHLAFSWFGDTKANALDSEIGAYVVSSGSFGTEERRVLGRMQSKTDGKRVFYIFRRLFPTYQSMCASFPVLKKMKILLPFFWIWRMIYAGIFRRGKLRAEIETVSKANEEALQQRIDFFRRCGLNY